MTRVYLLQDIIPSYRVPVFRRVAALPGVDLTVFYSRPTREMHGEGLRNAADSGVSGRCASASSRPASMPGSPASSGGSSPAGPTC